MECQDVRSLLTFAQRGCEDLDAAEREALQAHLDKCPDCTAITQAERRLDEALGQVMRDVPVPSGLQANVLKRLAGERRPMGWSRIASVAGAAAAVLLVVGGAIWHFSAVPEVTVDEVAALANRELVIAVVCRNAAKEPEEVERYFEGEGLSVKVPRDFNYQHLQRIEIVRFKKRPVAKLSFRNGEANAEIIILPHHEFNTGALGGQVHHTIQVRYADDFTYLILHSDGGLAPLLLKQA